MSSVSSSDAVIRRLRGLKLIPPGTGAVLSRQGRSRSGPQGAKVLWEARDAVSGLPLGVASRFGVRHLAGCERWQLRQADGVIYVEPEGRLCRGLRAGVAYCPVTVRR